MSARAVIYTRFSTDKQGESSTSRQLETCREYAVKNGLTVVLEESEEISSGVPFEVRPGGTRVLATLTRGDTLLVEHTDRLMRSEELAPLINRMRRDGVRVVGVKEQLDSNNRRMTRMQAAINGLAGAEFREAISEKTRDAQRFAFEQGYHVGGRVYGYNIRTTDVQYKPGHFRKLLEIDSAQAPVVLRIFEQYADGSSPRAIASKLNDECVTSPGANWNRSTRRKDGKWLASTILAQLNNSTYTGHITFCVQFSHTHERRDNGARIFVPGEQVIERHDERLRIVPQELWERVKARQNHRARVAGEKVKAGLRQRRPGGGTTGKHLLSGLLKCSECRGSYALSNKIRYQCSSHHEGGPGACEVSLSVPRVRIEGVIKEFIEDELLNPRRLQEIAERYRAAAASEIVIDYGPRIAKLEAERTNLISAIKAGGLAEELGTELRMITAELARLNAARPKSVTLPRVMSEESIERRRAELLQRLAEGGHVAREVLREIFPDAIQLQPDDSGKHLWAVFVHDVGATRVNLLYNTAEERLSAQDAAVLAAFEAKAVGNNGSGGLQRSHLPTQRRHGFPCASR